MFKRLLLSALFALPAAASAIDPFTDPLSLSLEEAPAAEGTASPAIGLAVEAGVQRLDGRAAASFQGVISLDFRHEWAWGGAWRATLSDRLESTFELTPFTAQKTTPRNALREAFLSWRANLAGGAAESGAFFLDLGRINYRLGVASGYNPTDYLRRGAALAGISQNPASVRQNRLGSVMVRGQFLSAGQSLAFSWIPRLSERDSMDTRDLALGLERTNREQAFILRFAPALGERVSLDVPLFIRHGRAEAGVNATALLSDSLVALAELSIAKRTAIAGPAAALAGRAPPEAHAAHLAVGATWTSPQGISLTLEKHYAGEALSKAAWRDWQDALRNSPAQSAAAFGRLSAELAERQDLLVREMVFARLAWDDAFSQKGLNLAAFARINAYDRSLAWQLEAAWNDRRDRSLRFIAGGNRGGPFTEFGARPQKGYAAANVIFYY